MIIAHEKSRLKKYRTYDIPLTSSLSAQVGSSATIVRATNATYVNTNGVLTSASSNVARFEKQGLLIEKAATNLLPDSYDITAVSWFQSEVGVTQSGIAPDGSYNSYKITATADLSISTAIIAFTGSSSACFSVWVKKGNVNNIVIASQALELASYTLTDEWQRVSLSCPTAATYYAVAPSRNGAIATAMIGDYFYMAFAQLESGTFPTSYISTSGGTAARNADSVSVSSASFPAANQSFTIACTYSKLGTTNDGGLNRAAWAVEGLSFINCIAISDPSGANYNPTFVCGASNVADFISAPVGYTFDTGRLVCRFTSTGVAGTSKLDMFHNGLKIATKTGITGFATGSATSISIGNVGAANFLTGNIFDFKVYARALTDKECQLA